MDWKDIFARAGKTFVQAFVTAVPVAAIISASWPVIAAGAIAGGAAALSVVWNALLQWSRQ